jgi:hypothetical protein
MGVDPHEDHFREWLRRRLSGCAFAADVAGRRKGIVYYTVLDRLSVETLSAVVDGAETRSLFVAVMFPRVRQPSELVSFLTTIGAHPRWSVFESPPRAHRPDGGVDISVEWTTLGGYLSSAMGFAPLGTMPATRRAPYYALVLWPGGHSNPRFVPRDIRKVGFIDAALDVTQDAYDTLMQTSKSETTKLLSDPLESSKPLREIAFCLPASAWQPQTVIVPDPPI